MLKVWELNGITQSGEKCLKLGKLNHLTPRLRSATDGEDFKRNGTVGTSNNVKLMMENGKCKTLLFFFFTQSEEKEFAKNAKK